MGSMESHISFQESEHRDLQVVCVSVNRSCLFSPYCGLQASFSSPIQCLYAYHTFSGVPNCLAAMEALKCQPVHSPPPDKQSAKPIGDVGLISCMQVIETHSQMNYPACRFAVAAPYFAQRGCSEWAHQPVKIHMRICKGPNTPKMVLPLQELWISARACKARLSAYSVSG